MLLTVMDEPMQETGAFHNGLYEFLSLDQDDQLAYIEAISLEELITLQSLYVQSIGNRSLRPVEYTVFERMLAKADPDGHNEYMQDSEILMALSPDSLRALRLDTYDNSLRPFLFFPAEKQDAYLDSLGKAELVNLLELLGRYAKEFGRSQRVREMEQRVKSMTRR